MLVRWRAETVPDGLGLRLIAPEDLHATLCFLGWRGAQDVDEIWGACQVAAAEEVVELRLGDAMWLPKRRPRVLAVALEDRAGALTRMQSTLSRALAAGGWYAPESRPYLAHVTVARVSNRARPRARQLVPPPPLATRGSCVTLYRSQLGPSGARYEPLRTLELGPCS